MNRDLVTVPNPAQRYLDAIARNPDLLPTTKRQYERAVTRAVEAGVNLSDPLALRDYATAVTAPPHFLL